MTLRGCYRTDHKRQRSKATINVIASLRSGVATMVRMPGYVSENPQAIPQTADAGWLRAIRWLLEPTVMGDGTPKAVNVDSFATHGIFVGIQ